ncbi:WS/DGAT domain-containing protein [Rhodococcoides yunnanense]|uniref:WS/DGAT domain-containing protein n=1 Tax=Rhodococcoides yunnanense TaxID=278209 RepID=UPI000933E10D|nr:WS/DGAT domain-containing protein [Rhodococcus yunnanensis]
MPGRLHPTDAQTYWMSSVIPNDQFALFCFETSSSATSVSADLIGRARGIADLGLRIQDSHFGYPRTAPAPVGLDRVVDHGCPGEWRSCLTAVAALFADQVDPREQPWRIHLFEQVTGAPRCTEPALVVVLQFSHALGDGQLVSALARSILGDHDQRAPSIAPHRRPNPAEFVTRARRAREFDHLLRDDTAAGRVPPQAPGRPRTRVNIAPRGTTSVRTIVRDRTELARGATTVTVGALTAVSSALSRYLVQHGDTVPGELGAEVTMAMGGDRRARNHFRNAGVDLHPEIDDLRIRASRISASLDARRTRADHPAMEAQARAAEMVPALLLRWGIRQFDATAIPETVTGNTVVSSVARGPADLTLGGGPVRFTAGFPALSPVMSLTHGVHGIGDVVTIAITSASSAVPDPDVYEQLMHDAVDDVARALRRTARSG